MMKKPNCPIIAIEEHYWDPELARHFTGPEAGRGNETDERLYDLGSLRLKEMDEAGIDIQVLSHGAPSTQKLAVDIAADLTRQVNDRLGKVCAANPKCFAAFAALPTADPKAAWLKEHVKRIEEYTGRRKDYPISWVKGHGRGRVFYSGLGFNRASAPNPELVEYGSAREIALGARARNAPADERDRRTFTRVDIAGDMLAGVLRLAEEVGAELVAVPNRGEPGQVRVFLPNLAEPLLVAAPCSVLVVPDATKKEAA